jgi:hypothetical protein
MPEDVVALENENRREATAISDLLYERAGGPANDPSLARARFALLRLRRDVHNDRTPDASDLETAGPLITERLAVRLKRYAERLQRIAAARHAYETRHAERVLESRRELLRIAAEPLVEHGIYLASRSLLPKAQRLGRRDPAGWSHGERHTAAKLAAYISRFAAKTSPNGVFCAVAQVRVGGRTARVAGRAEIAHVDVLLSLAEARKVSACLAIDPAAERAVTPRVNPTLREHEGFWTYWKPASPRNPTDAEVLARVTDQPLLRAFVEEARGSGLDPAGLVETVAARVGHPPEGVRPFYVLLVERGILVGEVEIAYSSRRRLRDLAVTARHAGCDAAWIPDLERIECAVDEIPALPLARRNDAMEEGLPRARAFKADELFRVDSASGLTVQLPARLLDDLAHSVRVLVRLVAGMFPESIQHRRLVSRFLGGHAPDVDVPFLDLYRGFGEAGEIASGAPHEFPAPGDNPPSNPLEIESWRCRRRIWEWFVGQAEGAAPGSVVELDASTARALAGDFAEPRWSAGALFQIASKSAAGVSEGRYAIVVNGLFNGIGLALSRFAHLLGGGRSAADNELLAELRRAWRAMERPGAVLAELTFNHEARTANAGLRPVLFDHEIELPGDLGSHGVERIPLGDLSLRYSRLTDRLVLRSVSRGVEVIPVLSSGVSPSGIVSELIHIGRQGWQTVGYLPGFEAPHVTHWPRFVCGRVVLFRARWTFGRDRLPPTTVGGAPLGEAAFLLELTRWRDRHGLPRHVFVHTATETKPFYVDFCSPVLTDLLRRAMTAVGSDRPVALYVTEMMPDPDALWVRDESGAYASEFLVQLEGPEAVSSS